MGETGLIVTRETGLVLYRVPMDGPTMEEFFDDLRTNVPQPLRVDGVVLLIAAFLIVALILVSWGIRRL